MIRVYWPACIIASDRVASGFLALDPSVVILLAHRLDVIEIEEQCRVALMRLLMVGHRCPRVMTVAFKNDAAAALAGVDVADEGLSPDAVRPAPTRICIELPVLLGFCASVMNCRPGCHAQAIRDVEPSHPHAVENEGGRHAQLK